MSVAALTRAGRRAARARPSSASTSRASARRRSRCPRRACSSCSSSSALHFAMPKSASLGSRFPPTVPNRMFCGLISRCTMPSAWASASAAHIAPITRTVSTSDCLPCSRMICESVPPFMNSQTWSGMPSWSFGAEVAEVVDAERVRVRQPRQRERLLDEVLVARAADAGLAAEPGEHLDADRARQPLVEAAEHDAVAAATRSARRRDSGRGPRRRP